MQTRTQYEGKLIQVPEALIEEQIGKLTQSLSAQFKVARYGFHLVTNGPTQPNKKGINHAD